jgi:hypothetical protein
VRDNRNDLNDFSRMFKKAGRRGRSERGGDAYSVPYVAPLSDARTKLEAFFNILLATCEEEYHEHTGGQAEGCRRPDARRQ